jgi:hypothetical protein
MTSAMARSRLPDRLGGPKWPDNGLTFEENRRLFASKDSDEVAYLVVTGLLRRFATSAPVKVEQ